tara:strand:- start:3988 stop:4308 length:321 start_codon:yes stop_codon:yes gene_type:complete
VDLLEGLVGETKLIGGVMMVEIPASVRKKALDMNFKPSVRIGKTGITETVVEEISVQLKKKGIVKIKINKGIFDRQDRKQVWQYLSEQTSSVVVLARGNVGVLYSR